MTLSITGSFLTAVLATVLWPLSATAQSPATPKDPVAKAQTVTATQLTKKAEAELKQIVSLNFDNVAFLEVKEELEKLTGLNFILTTSASDDALTEDETFSVKFTNMPLGQFLELMLAPKNATYVIDSGTILLISIDEANDEKWQRVKMFDCRELVKLLPKTAPPVQFLGLRGHGGGGGVFSLNLPQGAKKQSTEKKRSPESLLLDEKFEKLLRLMEQEAIRRRPEPSGECTLKNLIQTMTLFETWDDHGGMGQIDVINGIVIARNSEGTLREIEDLIADLEDKMLSKKAQPKATNRQPKASAKQLPPPSDDSPISKPTPESDGAPFGD